MTRYALRMNDGTILVRRVEDDQEVARFSARGDRDIFVFGFSPDGRYLATTHYPDRGLTVWDVDRRALMLEDAGRIAGHSASFAPDSRALALGHEDDEIVLYDLETPQLPQRWRAPTPRGLRDIAFRPDGVQIAVTSGTNDPVCSILETETGRLVRSIPLPTRGELAWNPDGTTLATTCDDLKI